MKHICKLLPVLCLAAGLAAACGGYDDSALRSDISDLKSRISSLEDKINSANTNLSSLQTLAQGLEKRLYVTGVTTVVSGYFPLKCNPYNGHEAVDLGLSVQWATCNLGATRPEEYGSYFSWGETEPKAYYLETNYKFGTDIYHLTKYCPLGADAYWAGIGSPDGKRGLDLEDDAARVNWGGNWRIPSYADYCELGLCCDWKIVTSENGVDGTLITGPNGNSIFLPAAGYSNGNISYYWLDSLYKTLYPYAGEAFKIDSYDTSHTGVRRFHGLPIRPVVDPTH